MTRWHYYATVLIDQINDAKSLTDLVHVSVRIDDAQYTGSITSDTAQLLRLAMHERADQIGKDGVDEFRRTVISEVQA